jgi:PmbA protein
MGTDVFAPHISMTESPHLPRAMGSAPFDDDGVATQARRIVDQGRLEAWFLSCYSARKLGLKTTGNAGGEHNLALVSAATRAEDDLPEMLRKLGTGLFVTELMGQGVNTVTGDYSRGATGFWVEGGVIAYPVEEITIAGNLRDMFRAIVAVGADVYDRGSRRSGSVLIERMALAGS